MSYGFNEVPASNLENSVFYEQDGSKALNSQPPDIHHVLILGIRSSDGTVAANVITPVVGEQDGDVFFGTKSHMADLCYAFKRVNRTSRVSAMALDEASGGTAATGTFPLVGTSSADGTLRVRVGDRRISVSLASGTAAADAATALETALDAEERFMWTAATSTATVTLTHSHKGETGNGFTFEVEAIPAGLTCTPVQPTNGATNPTMATTIALFDDERYDTIVTGLTDATTMAALEVEMLRRWDATVKMPGCVIAAVKGSHGTLTSYGNARNSRVSCVMGTGVSPTPPWIWAAQAAARHAQRCDTQPNQPRVGMTLPNCEAPKKADRFNHSERNLLLIDGISTFRVDQAGNVSISRMITTYQTNSAGLSDATYRSMEDLANLAGIYVELLILGNRYEGSILMDDDSARLVNPGIKVISPKAFKGVLAAWYEGLIKRGRARDLDGFVETLAAQINTLDSERLDALMSTRLARGLVTLAMKNDFLLSA